MPRTPREIRRTQAAIRDLIDLGDSFDAISYELSERFIAAAEATVARLASWPGLGEPWEDEGLGGAEVRCSTVDRFRRYLIFYRETESGILILRVVPGMRDLRGLPGLEASDYDLAPP